MVNPFERNTTNLGQFVKEHRVTEGIKQSELAERIGIGAPYISRMETGWSCPSLDVLEKMADYFNVPLIDLCRIIEKPKFEVQVFMKRYEKENGND